MVRTTTSCPLEPGVCLTLFTRVPGAPQPEYRWLKDGQYLGDFTSEHFYRIHKTKRSDAGEYQCIARNSVGAIFSEKAQVAVARE